LKGAGRPGTRSGSSAPTKREFYDMFVDIWPKALAILKDVCERPA